MTGPLLAEARMDDGEVNTGVIYRREGSGKTAGVCCLENGSGNQLVCHHKFVQ